MMDSTIFSNGIIGQADIPLKSQKTSNIPSKGIMHKHSTTLKKIMPKKEADEETLELRVRIAQNIKAKREGLGLSQKALADKLEVLPTYINKIEKGNLLPPVNFLSKLAEEFKTTIDCLAHSTDGEPEEVSIEDQRLSEKVRLLNTLNQEEKDIAVGVIDSLLFKRRVTESIKA